jgi:hypothetical protein
VIILEIFAKKAAPGAPLFYWIGIVRRQAIAVTPLAPDMPVTDHGELT